MFCKRKVLSAANYQMVQHTNVHELTAFDMRSVIFVSSAWFCTARRVIMREYHAGCIQFYCFAHNFTRMNLYMA